MFFKKRICLDYAAGTEGNPSSMHEEGRREKKKLEDARVEIARLTEVKADDVIFTSGATEANALAILGLPKRGDHVLCLPSAHASIVENAKLLAERGIEVEALPIAQGRVEIDALKRLLRPQTVLVSMEAVCGETGTIWNMREVKQAIGKAYLHVDASQAVMTEKISRAHFAADLLTLDGGKLGARGAGCLIAHRTIPLTPLYGGGGQERGLRSGTENVEAIEEFASALRNAHAAHDAFKAYAVQLRTQLVEAMSTIPNFYINEGHEAVPHILNISLPGRDTDYLAVLLDTAGFAVSTKSACESLSGEGSRAVFALTGGAARAATTLRISFGPHTTSHDIGRFARALRGSVAFVDSVTTR